MGITERSVGKNVVVETVDALGYKVKTIRYRVELDMAEGCVSATKIMPASATKEYLLEITAVALAVRVKWH